ncbi:hypothetical protein ACFFIO_15635 [Citricoccus parietis]|uniref:Flagellar hook-length control protein FliK n=1 Tax=Citricoccus parietis TaxID=592307 RepID=A0ABV6F8U3_9MICC
MIGSPVSSMIPGPTPDSSRSPSGSGHAGGGSRGPSFADHLRDASAPADASTGAEPASVLPEGFTPLREGREFTRPVSFDAVGQQADQAGQSDPVAGAESSAELAGSAEFPAAAGPEELEGPEGLEAPAEASDAQPIPAVPGAANPAVQATIITAAGNPASTVFNPGRNPAHAGQGPSSPAVVSGGPVQTTAGATGSTAATPATAGPFSATGRAAGDPAAAATAPATATASVTATATASATRSTPASQQSSPASATAGSQSTTTAPAAPITAAPITAAAVPATAATATVPAPSAESAAPAPSVRAWTVQQLSTPVVQAAGRAVSLPDGTHLATVRISPEALGPVTLEATSRDGAIRLEITAATEAGRENLRVVLTELRRELAAAQPGATLELSSGAKDAAPNGTGSSPGGRPGEGKDREGAGVGHSGTGTEGPGAETAATGTERQPGSGDRDGDGTGGLDVYA